MLEISKPENASIVSKTQDPLGLNSAKLEHLNYLYFQLGRFLINPLFRKKKTGPDPDFCQPELIEARVQKML